MRGNQTIDSHGQFPSTSRLLLALFLFSLLFMIPLVRYSFERIENEAKMRAEYLRLKAEVDRNAHCLVQLEAVVAYVQTDRFVEEWARERGRMALPGETLVVPYSSAPLVREAHPWWTDRVNCRE